MSDLNLIAALISDTPEINKREFLLEKLQNGESISNSKSQWTEDKLYKATDKVVDKLYEKYQNPTPVKINKQDALKTGEPICPIVIEMYAEGLKSMLCQIPFISGRYTIDVEKLKIDISSNKLFCDNLAIKIGSKMIEHGGNCGVGLSLATMTYNAIVKIPEGDIDQCENKKDVKNDNNV